MRVKIIIPIVREERWEQDASVNMKSNSFFIGSMIMFLSTAHPRVCLIEATSVNVLLHARKLLSIFFVISALDRDFSRSLNKLSCVVWITVKASSSDWTWSSRRSLLLLQNGLVALASLVLILDDILLLKLSHALDLVKVNNEALIVSVKWLDTLTTENVEMVRTVEVLDAFWMNLAELFGQAILIFVFKVKAGTVQNRVFLNNFVQDVDVKRKSLCAFQLLDQFAADGASYAILVVQLLDAARAQRVAAMDKYARNTLSNVVLEGTELADIKSPRLIVQVHQIHDAHFGNQILRNNLLIIVIIEY